LSSDAGKRCSGRRCCFRHCCWSSLPPICVNPPPPPVPSIVVSSPCWMLNKFPADFGTFILALTSSPSF
jgi:hypothetical protein